MWTISKEFTFDSAHSLPHLPVAHKCHHLHGHTYKLVVFCRGELIDDWLIDYAVISSLVKPLIERLDHKNLNDVMYFPTTAENLSKWIFNELKPDMRLLSRIDLHETTGTCCSYEP